MPDFELEPISFSRKNRLSLGVCSLAFIAIVLPLVIFQNWQSRQLRQALLNSSPNQIGLEQSSLSPSQPEEMVAIPTALTGNQKLAVILVNFKNKPQKPFNKNTVTENFFSGTDSVGNFYKEESFGRLTFTGDVYDWITLPRNFPDLCRFTEWRQEVNKILTSQGVDLGTYNFLVYLSPGLSSCNKTSPQNGEGYAWIFNSKPGGLTPKDPYIKTVGMEAADKIVPLSYARGTDCVTNVTGGVQMGSDADCQYYAVWGDYFSLNGSNQRFHHSSFYKSQLGWLSDDNIKIVERKSGLQEFTIMPNEFKTTGVQLLMVPRKNNEYYYLEFRQPTPIFEPFPLPSYVVNGVSIRMNYQSRDYNLSLLDMTPNSISDCNQVPGNLRSLNTDQCDFYDSALSVGRTFFDETNGVKITVKGMSRAGALVSVEAKPPSPTPTPTIACPSCAANISLTSSMRFGGKYNIILSWPNTGKEDSYQIYRCTGSGCNPITPITTLEANTSWYTDTNNGNGFASGTTLRYEVRPIKSGCTTLNCPDFQIIVPSSTTTTPPSNLTL